MKDTYFLIERLLFYSIFLGPLSAFIFLIISALFGFPPYGPAILMIIPITSPFVCIGGHLVASYVFKRMFDKKIYKVSFYVMAGVVTYSISMSLLFFKYTPSDPSFLINYILFGGLIGFFYGRHAKNYLEEWPKPLFGLSSLDKPNTPFAVINGEE